MSILRKFSDLLREVFWLKPKKRKSSSRKTARPSARKKTATKSVKPVRLIKPLKAAKPPKPLKLPKPPKPVKVKPPLVDPSMTKVGEITHYFERIKVCVLKVTEGTVLIGDRLTIVGKGAKFTQKVWSMQIESVDVKVARKGQLVGMKIDKPVAEGFEVYK